ncbi:MAG: hypothetical protein HOO67_05145 [Candidatus Peribacteraceae bacterium]|nr:hypothetical protein [Candidatus Peribacteraceae bacterium]
MLAPKSDGKTPEAVAPARTDVTGETPDQALQILRAFAEALSNPRLKPQDPQAWQDLARDA